MSKYSIIGFKHSTIKFKDNNEVTGFNLYLSQPRDGVHGYACESVFISDSKVGDYSPALNDIIDVAYNRWGKIESISKVK